MAEAEITIHLLEDIKDILEYSLENNEYTRILFGKVHGNLDRNPIPEDTQDFDGSEDTEETTEDRYPEGPESLDHPEVPDRYPEGPEPLEIVLHEKLQENARLKALNGRLLASTRQKSAKIKDLTRAVSLQDQLVENSEAISTHRDQLGRCNVEIQALRKQLKLESKRLQSERAKSARLETCTSGGQDSRWSSGRAASSVSSTSKSVQKIDRRPATRPSLGKTREDRLQKVLQMIESQKEPSIHDETLDMPESLDSDSDEKCQCL